MLHPSMKEVKEGAQVRNLEAKSNITGLIPGSYSVTFLTTETHLSGDGITKNILYKLTI